MEYQCPARGTSCKYPSSGAFRNYWSRTTCRVWQNRPSAGRQQRPHRRPAAKNARPRSRPGQRRRRRRRARTRAGSVSPRHGRAGQRGMAIPPTATGISTTTSTAAPTQPASPHPPPHQASLDSSSRLSSRSSNRSSNLNSSPNSSSNRRRPRGAGFSSHARPTAVGEAEADVEAPTRRRRERRFLTVWTLPTGRADSRGGGEPERAGTLFADAGRSVGPRGVPQPGSVSPALFHGEKKRLNTNCSTDSRSWFYSQMPYDILPQNATAKSREVRVPDTSHLTRATEIQNSLAVAKPASDQAVPYRKSEISQQKSGGGAVSTQIGHAPVRLEAQGPAAVQCRQNDISQQQKNSSRAVLSQIGHEPGRLEARGQTAVQCRQNENLQQQNGSGVVSTQIGYAPVRLEAQGQTAVQRRQSDSSQQQNSSRAVSNQIGHAPVGLGAHG